MGKRKANKNAGLDTSLHSDTSATSSFTDSPPPKASRINSPSLGSAQQFSNHLQAILTDKLSSLSPENQTLVDCISSVIYSFFSNSNSSLVNELQSQQSKILSLSNQISSYQSDFSKQQKEISELKSIVHSLQKSLTEQQEKSKSLEAYIESIDCYQRRETLIISGEDLPPECPKEDSTKVALSLIQSKLHYTIPTNEVSVAHRLGPKLNDKKRPIIVKFVRRSVKHDIIRKCVQIKPKFGVSESLSPYRRRIYSILRSIKGPRGHHSDIEQLHSNDGTIVVKLTSSNSFYRIFDEKSLSSFLDGHPNIKDLYHAKLTTSGA